MDILEQISRDVKRRLKKLVEAAGIEPASEKAGASVPTSVASVLFLGSQPPTGRLLTAQPAFFFVAA
ncbi:MAG: hypothetical protein LASZOEIN_002025 [Candidatus Fervidibacter sp.]